MKRTFHSCCGGIAAFGAEVSSALLVTSESLSSCCSHRKPSTESTFKLTRFRCKALHRISFDQMMHSESSRTVPAGNKQRATRTMLTVLIVLRPLCSFPKWTEHDQPFATMRTGSPVFDEDLEQEAFLRVLRAGSSHSVSLALPQSSFRRRVSLTIAVQRLPSETEALNRSPRPLGQRFLARSRIQSGIQMMC